MIALVTGATGLAGSYLVERLRREGWEVRALVRDPARAAWLRPSGAELCAGDILDGPSLTAAARGCDVVFHTAAVVTRGRSWEVYRRPNVDGTAAVIAAAAQARARLVHLSSVAVYGAARYGAGGGVDESTPFGRLAERDFYGRSKRESEGLVFAAHRAGEVWATAIRPCVIYGRRDRQFVPRFARLVMRRRIPLVGGGAPRFAVVHAANVADAAFRAATTDAAGGRAYVTANDAEVSYVEFARLAARGLGRDAHFLRIPVPLARAGVAAARVAALAAGHADVAARLPTALDFISRSNTFSSARAVAELGWTPVVRPEEGVPDAFAWWARNGERGAGHG